MQRGKGDYSEWRGSDEEMKERMKKKTEKNERNMSRLVLTILPSAAILE